ncbi:MAG: 50S ribosomal protein L28 [Endomicrobium sp.]|uniref:50S ribosomal protein L28 n=1 Tax=Candidatus Endomicrobiellum pyrsonymphae TaxID=1408203 RepID=UPI00357F2F3F|nr:50S ribosomal protein L28 [Endomicrobium sp.]MCA6070556.1 50S ribosomal protein L28 [Endomicrobium sp.]
MSYKCVICGKGSTSGNTISHSNKASKRLFRPNLQSLNIILAGKKTHRYVCTSCVKSNKVKKAI